jgi:DNA polymerase-3 subunit delta
VFTGVKMDGRTRFGQALKDAAVVVDCSPLPDAHLSGWIQAQANRLGVRVTDAAVQLLMDLGGLYRIRGELEKLAAFVPEGKTADVAEVERVKGGEPDASVFDLAEAIGRQDRAQVLRILKRNLEAGEAPLRILGSLAWQYRRLWGVKELTGQKRSEGEIAKALGIHPFRVREMLAQVRLYPAAHLRRAFFWMFETDSALKGGSAGAGDLVLESLLLRLCDDVAENARARPVGPTPPAVGATRPGTGRVRPISNVRNVRSDRPSRRSP